jgi:hypothetical protein
MSRFPQAGLDRLAERVVGGEVVFFVGAGFSIDSEGNTAERLIGRLLARFDAMTSLLAGQCLTPLPAVEVAARARELRQGLRVTFAVEEIDGYLTTPTQVATLAREYYTINDWLASAFSLLLGEIRETEKLPDREQFLARLGRYEQFLVADRLGERPPRLSPIKPADLERLAALPAVHRGKALFLETMGFADREVMAGLPCDPDLSTVERSYSDRLRPRHRVLAWLAREGLAPVLLTTNFDLLLEGAYRLAGLTPRFSQWDLPQPLHVPQPLKGAPPATFDFFLRITSASEFFGRGDDRRSAQLLKIHGCAESYRWVRDRTESVQGYLPAIVFTFREIQNWRGDSWSRDLLSTLLRTRTMVFCGYSGTDPVLHDTIRTVYEEMARRRSTGGLGHAAAGGEAPAFFLGSSGKTEFHGMEILRAASRAAGGDPGLTDHLNYLRFHLASKGGASPFPLLDEVMRWLFHLAFRRRQHQALEADLGRVATVLLGHPCPEVERRAVLEEFARLRRAEETAAAGWDERPDHRLQFERMVSWVESFQVRLLREFALADAVLRASGPGLELARLRRSQWYYPALDHTDWAAWGAVVELALRRRIAAWQQVKRWERDSPWLASPQGSSHPALLYARGALSPTPSCLTVRLLPSSGHDQDTIHGGPCRRRRAWDLDSSEIPWRRTEKGSTPGAERLWTWAHRPLAEIAGGDFEPFL